MKKLIFIFALLMPVVGNSQVLLGLNPQVLKGLNHDNRITLTTNNYKELDSLGYRTCWKYGDTGEEDKSINFFRIPDITEIINFDHDLLLPYKAVSSNAFSGFENLQSIFIPYSIEAILMPFFDNCPSVERIDVDSANQYFTSIDGVLYNKDTTELICFPPAKSAKKYVMPKSVKVIGTHAFAHCSKLGNFKIPDHVTDIQSHAFSYSCLKKLTIPGTCKVIEELAFSHLRGRKGDYNSNCHIKLQSGIENIGEGAFMSSRIRSIKIPNSVKYIGVSAFNSTKLKSITIPGSVKSVEAGAFSDIRELSKVIIENGVEKIGNKAFNSMPFRFTHPNKFRFTHPNKLSVIIPSSVKGFGDNVFADLSSISCSNDTSARMKFLLYKCMMEVHIANYRNDSAQYYVNKVADILKSLHNDGNDYSRLYSILVDFYSKLYDFPKMKLYCKESIEHITQLYSDTAKTKLNPLLLKLADANISLYEYKEADSVLNFFETINGIRHINEWIKYEEMYVDVDGYLDWLPAPPNIFADGKESDYWYEKVKLYYESNDSQNLKVITQEPHSSEYRYYRHIDNRLTSYWLRTNVILFKNLTWNNFKYFIHCIDKSPKEIVRTLDFSLGSTIGDCYYHYNQVDSAFVYYSKVFDFELKDLKNYYSYMNVYQRQYYWQEHKATFDNVVKIATKLPDNKDALIMAYNSLLVSKGLLLASEESLSNNIQNTKDEKLIADFYKLKKYRAMLDSDCDPNMRDNILELAGRLETDLMLRSTQYADVVNYMKIDWQKVRNSLGDNDMAVEFFFNNDSLYALALKKDFDAPKLVVLDGFNTKLSYYSNTDIYNSVWKPLEQYFSPKGNVYFSPDGALYNIAIEYAPIDSTHIISQKYKIYRISSTRNLALKKGNHQKTK